MWSLARGIPKGSSDIDRVSSQVKSSRVDFGKHLSFGLSILLLSASPYYCLGMNLLNSYGTSTGTVQTLYLHSTASINAQMPHRAARVEFKLIMMLPSLRKGVFAKLAC